MTAQPPAAGLGAVRIWVLAARLPTLTAAIAPVLVGTALAQRDHAFRPGAALAALLGALAIQIGANFANDVSDFRRGADVQRIGPPRVTQLGLLTERQVLNGLWAAFALATLAGIYLTLVAGWPVIAIGAASILAAMAYTGGPWPYGYRALGEVFTFLFFGVIAVAGTYFVQADEVTRAVLAASVPVACTVTAILVVNNYRDLDTDRDAGKRTLAVRLGRIGTQRLFIAIVAVAYLAAAGLWLFGRFPVWVLLGWVSMPLAVPPVAAVLSTVQGPPLNRALRATARLHLAFALLLAVGIVL